MNLFLFTSCPQSLDALSGFGPLKELLGIVHQSRSLPEGFQSRLILLCLELAVPGEALDSSLCSGEVPGKSSAVLKSN